ncbi:hypothetical protein G6F38_013060 [Rhizopus arrhizus]|nr:hypothetical protein G6F38_013060 [Rhizopus arrhizus]
MVFSDETKVNVYGSDGCKYVWSRPDDKLEPHHLDLTVKGGGVSIMVWGCIAYDGLEHYDYNPQDIYFQQDNDPKHTSKLARQWFKDNNFKCDHTFNWPSQSPDLNPIEHIWHHLKLKLSAYDIRAKGVHELWDRVEKEWSTFTAEDCRRYIDSMPDRCRAFRSYKALNLRDENIGTIFPPTVKQVIDKLTKVNLKLNPDKCTFFQSKINLLGFRISPKGVSLDLRKVANVQEFPVPKTGKDIMRYCGLINYFRPHIPKASSLLAPLDALRNEKSLIKLWNDKHQQCFDNLKKVLLENVILSYPDLNQTFYVATDASNVVNVTIQLLSENY